MAEVVRIKGLAELKGKLNIGLIAGPLRTFLTRAAILVQSRARERAPVDTGRLRADIAFEVDGGTPPIWARVGNNVFYAPYVEYGTGTQTDGPGGGGRHWPPAGALSGWAGRHGFGPGGGFIVARAIGRRGGLRPRRYLRDALDAALSGIEGLFGALSRDIEAEAEK